jgi:hypothetical protein
MMTSPDNLHWRETSGDRRGPGQPFGNRGAPLGHPLSLTFIDGSHAYETVQSDYNCWHPHLLPAGFLIFHDIYPNPQDGGQAPYEVDRSALSSVRFKALPMTGSLGVLQRIS